MTDDDNPTARAIRLVKAQALRDAANDLLKGLGPDEFAGADDSVAHWLLARAVWIEDHA